MRKFRYFVHFVVDYKNFGKTDATTTVTTKKRIKSIQDIRKIEEELRQQLQSTETEYINRILILNWKEF